MLCKYTNKINANGNNNANSQVQLINNNKQIRRKVGYTEL